MRHVIFVTAHPDDESMFFGPSIRSLSAPLSSPSHSSSSASAAATVHLLCLTDGSYPPSDGAVRKAELLLAASYLSLDPSRVHVPDLSRHGIVDSPLPSPAWSASALAAYLHEYVSEHCSPPTSSFDSPHPLSTVTLVTFDERGVSGHPNHVDTYRGVCSYLESSSTATNTTTATTTTTGYKLRTVSLLEKYCVPFHLLRTLLSLLLCSNSTVCLGWKTSSPPTSVLSFLANVVSLIVSPLFFLPSFVSTWRSMGAHYSQWVWYRKLFVFFSVYSYVNVLDRIPALNPLHQRQPQKGSPHTPPPRRPPSARKVRLPPPAASAAAARQPSLLEADAEARKVISAHVRDARCAVPSPEEYELEGRMGYLSERQIGLACMVLGALTGLFFAALLQIKFAGVGEEILVRDPSCSTPSNPIFLSLTSIYDALKNDTYFYMAVPLSLVPFTLLYYINWLGFKLYIRNSA